MFSALGAKIKASLAQLGKQATLTAENTAPALQEVRLALLEADTAVPVVKSLIETLRAQALGGKVQKSLNPGQTFIKIVHTEIVKILGETQEPLNLRTEPPAVLMVVGLQGSGKTTSLVKTAFWLKKQRKKKSLLCSLDLSRPAAVEQLRVLADQAQLDFYAGEQGSSVLGTAQEALNQARLGAYDCLFIDTTGRLQTNPALMKELNELRNLLNPIETLYVLDAMGGQDAVRVAAGFKKTIDLSGVIVSKLDSTTRGGAIFSVQYLLKKPIKLIGNGEKLTDIIDFHPSSMADRILGMGDMLTVIRQVEMTTDTKDRNKIAEFITGKRFNFNHLRSQLVQMNKMGGLSSMIEKMGLDGQLAAAAEQQLGDKHTKKFIALIDSMTPAERRNPEFLNGSRKMRISKGAGSNMQEFNQMIKKFKQLRKMSGKAKSLKKQQKLMQHFNHVLGTQSPFPR